MNLTRAFIFSAAISLVLLPSFVRAEEFDAQLEKLLQTEKGQRMIGSAIEKYAKLREKDEEQKQAQAFENSFKNPVKIDVGNSPTKGPKDAKITVVEFSDFQCPFCQRGASTMEQVLKAYPKDVKLVFKNLPLQFHKDAEPAARAALAAGVQGKYWEMHDALFKNQASLSDALYEDQAKQLGLNVTKFKEDMNSSKIVQAVKDDMQLASSLGVRGTPNFFVNGVQVNGAMPFDHFKMIIERWLGNKS